MLGASYCGGAAYHGSGVEAKHLAEQAWGSRHRVSAREAFLWAADYFYAALRFLDGTEDPGRMLTGWLLSADNSGRRRPLIIMNNGADGLESRMYTLGGAGALARGCHCLICNGPGQGDSLWVRRLYFRPGWEKVITPVVDAMLRRPEVDAKRIGLLGVSMGGFWVPRALG